MKKHIGTFLIVFGIVIIAVPLIGRYMASRRQDELMAAFLEQSAVAVESDEYDDLSASLEWGAQVENQDEIDAAADEGLEEVDSPDGSAENDTDETEESSNLGEAEAIKAKPDAVALMEIDKIDVYLPVAEGTDLGTLKFALGHMTETAPLGSIGNAVVAGHRSHSFGTFFNRLDEVEVGDEIRVTIGGKTYVYEVFETKIVEPTDLSVLRGSSEHRVLTLITCHPIYTSTHRLIVHAVVREE